MYKSDLPVATNINQKILRSAIIQIIKSIPKRKRKLQHTQRSKDASRDSGDHCHCKRFPTAPPRNSRKRLAAHGRATDGAGQCAMHPPPARVSSLDHRVNGNTIRVMSPEWFEPDARCVWSSLAHASSHIQHSADHTYVATRAVEKNRPFVHIWLMPWVEDSVVS